MAAVLGYLIGREAAILVAPFAITVDQAGRMYVVDTFHRRVHLFDVAAGEFQAFPESDSPMNSPVDIAVDDAADRIYVADSKDAVVRVFAGAEDPAPRTIGGGLLQRPTGLAINRLTDELVVVDTKLSAVFRFDLDRYQLKGRFGVGGTAPGFVQSSYQYRY